MKIITDETEYSVAAKPILGVQTVRLPLEEAPEAVGETVALLDNDGAELCPPWVAADWLRCYLDGTTLVLTQTPEAEVAEPTLSEVKADKLAELSVACNTAIVAGCDVTLSTGSGHISLTAEDQINLTTSLAAVEQGAVGYPYHLDRELCAVYPAADIITLAQAATAHKLYHTTYYNHLTAWVRRCESAEAVEAITYGAELPEDLAANLAAVLAAAGGGDA